MRQWELFGITDSDLCWTPPRPTEAGDLPAAERRERGVMPEVLWSTDAALRITSASWTAGRLVRFPVPAEGTSLLDVFGLEGDGADAVAAHVQALCGGQAAFPIFLDDRTLRCRVVPLRGEEGEITGTICVGIHEISDAGIPIAEDAEPIRVA